MLAEAARKAPAAKLVQADIRELPMLGRFDLVTCFDDSLNHLSEERDLASAFGSIAANLLAGAAMFDLNTLLAYRTTFAADSVSAHGDRFRLAGRVARGRRAGLPGGRLDRGLRPPRARALRARDQLHAQRHFPRERVLDALPAGGARVPRSARRPRRRRARP